MSAPQSLLQAALQRLGARLGSGLVDGAATLALLAQDAPERLRQELQLFWDEVEAEAERIERDGQGLTTDPHAPDSPDGASQDPQDQIDALRAKVAAMARRLDQPS
ncbi:hypothetical protein KBY71_11110 [Cyanobium sp. T1B-Tous]|uniref:hypothetical protein n=1 Tax=Cyanobium sp. T1B-Tous TaxID=2823721 RepID=UPI0020CFE34F|nr:hypothetical protein [Cyanobium sp. T1B-Tous]MCP9807062.1 hypothetical protein [Cyanobium sp. T1B-Tous]MCX5939716.1 hypothetical protein [Cyanobium sp. LacPavin_0818_WC50_MAG_67_9]